MALGVLATAILAWYWTRRAFNERAAFYAALALLTGVGVFLFTRIDIPEALLTFFIGLALYCFLVGLEDKKPALFYISWASLAIAMLAKGLIAPVFFFAAVLPWLVFTGKWRRWREMRLATGLLLFLGIAAPWHVLAGLRNPGPGQSGRQSSRRLAMCTAFFTSTSSTSRSCASSASAGRWITTSSRDGSTGWGRSPGCCPGAFICRWWCAAHGAPAHAGSAIFGSMMRCSAFAAIASGCFRSMPASCWSSSPSRPTRSTTPFPHICRC